MQQSVFLFGLPEMDGDMIAQEIVIPAEHKEKLRTELANDWEFGRNTIFRSTVFLREIPRAFL